MSEKGGKGYSLPPSKGGKPTSTPSSALKGNNDTAPKSKRGRKPKVSFTDSLEDMMGPTSLGKGDNPTSKANLGKGGKGYSNLNTGKASKPKQPAKLELRVENELPNNVKCLMDCEAARILEGIQDQMVMLSEDPTIKIPASFDKGLQYAITGDHYTDPQSVRQHLETLKKKYGVSDGEICMIANINADTTDEVFGLIPSLKPKRSMLREPINDLLKELAKLKQSTQCHDDIF